MGDFRVLIVDDEEDLRELVQYNLNKAGFQTVVACDGLDALDVLEKDSGIDLIVLDLMMPNMSGLEVCRILKSREDCKSIPILMLTAKGEESDIVLGLELGADDYMTKPFSNRVLIARIETILRRTSLATEVDPESEGFVRGELGLNLLTRTITIKSEKIKTTFNEFEIIKLLAKNPGWVKSRNQIIKAVHGDDYPVTDRAIDVQIVGLRKKMKSLGHYIETVRGVGYRFKEVEIAK